MTLKEFSKILKKSPLPYLFIGSGFSRRYANTPDWEGLLKNICKINNIQYNVLAYQNKIDGTEKVDCPAIATEIEKKLYEIYLEKDKEYDYRQYNPLKRIVSEQFKKMEIVQEPEYQSEIESFKILTNKISGIITTNYDLLLEKLCEKEKFVSIVGQKGLLLKNEAVFVNEIYKIHGCITEEESIILTKGDYENFLEKQKYILGKLMVIFTEYPIIFLGYDLKDNNILKILEDLSISLSSSELDKISKKWLFISWKKGEKELNLSDYSISLNENKTEKITLNCIQTDNFKKIFEFLSNIDYELNIKKGVLKKIRGVLNDYQIAPSGQKAIIFDKELLKEFEQNNNIEELSINIGMVTRFLRLDKFKIIRDFLYLEDISNYKSKEYIEEYLDKTQKGKFFFPRYKFFSREELEKNGIEDKEIDDLNIPEIKREILEKDIQKEENLHIVSKFWENIYRKGEMDENNIEKLEKYLKSKIENIKDVKEFQDKFKSNGTHFRKMIVLLDNLKYNKNLTK
jgi:PXO2-73